MYPCSIFILLWNISSKQVGKLFFFPFIYRIHYKLLEKKIYTCIGPSCRVELHSAFEEHKILAFPNVALTAGPTKVHICPLSSSQKTWTPSWQNSICWHPSLPTCVLLWTSTGWMSNHNRNRVQLAIFSLIWNNIFAFLTLISHWFSFIFDAVIFISMFYKQTEVSKCFWKDGTKRAECLCKPSFFHRKRS